MLLNKFVKLNWLAEPELSPLFNVLQFSLALSRTRSWATVASAIMHISILLPPSVGARCLRAPFQGPLFYGVAGLLPGLPARRPGIPATPTSTSRPV